MAKKDIKFTLDTIDSRYSPVGTVKQLDSVFFYIKITENGVTKDLTGQTIKLFGIKEDKKIVEQTTKINITNQREGLVEIELLNAAIQVHGFTYFELEISDSNGIISTSDFILRVNKRVGSNEAIESTNEVATLKKIEEYVAQAKVELQKFKNLQVEMLETNNSINSQEDLRLEAEKSRVDAEKGRVAAETKREEAFNKVEGRITANTEELKTARTATTGENFDSIDERIDCEVNRINEKIEISFLEQEDSESHTIENTVEGMTTDMIVKGKTLKNIFKWKGEFNGAFARMVNTSLFKPSTKYTIFHNTKLLGLKDYIVFASERLTSENQLKNGDVFTTDASIPKNSYFHAYNSNDEGNVPIEKFNKIKVVILEGEWTSIIPDYFEGIKSFGEEINEIHFLSATENLAKENISFNVTANKELFSDFYECYLPKLSSFTIGVVSSSDIVLNIYFYDAEKNIVDNWSFDSNSNRYIENPEKHTKDSYYFRLQVSSSNNVETRITKAGLYLGDFKNRDFGKFNLNRKKILLNSYGFDFGLRGLNDTIYDELNSMKNMATKRIGKHTFSGRENISKWADSEDACWFTISNNFDFNYQNNEILLCNNFAEYSHGFFSSESALKTGVEGISANNDYFTIRIKKKELESADVAGFKKWLKENETVVYYELAEPIETLLIESINVKTLTKKTYIRFENDLSGTSSFKAPVNTLATISRLNRENRALEEENLSLRQDLESTTLALTDGDLELVKQNVDMDFRLMEVEFALDIPQAILSSDIKFKNKKGEVKTMARTPYEMMKIVILSGDYDREDYMHKVGKYYERGRMTKEEHDELMSLMTADEVLNK
ncbi:BppU family phage baseplate upper protein [Clostridium perfringens]|nr:BppU family phage baseplate upper protein [Clostridium perfringens]